jgi:hypothetical protein
MEENNNVNEENTVNEEEYVILTPERRAEIEALLHKRKTLAELAVEYGMPAAVALNKFILEELVTGKFDKEIREKLKAKFDEISNR